MPKRTINLDPRLYDYVLRVAVRETEVLRDLREETRGLPDSGMQISPDQGQFLSLLVKMLGARRCLEIGVFTGYSSLVVAAALPDDGRLVACDLSEEWTRIARRHWQRAGVDQKIELRLGPALATLDALLEAGSAGSFDFAFVDAEKTEYVDYYERVLELLAPGGVCAIDNVLWNGRVVELEDQSAETTAIRAFNEHLATDTRVDLSLVPVGDGLTLARKHGGLRGRVT